MAIAAAATDPFERAATAVRTYDRDRYLADLFAPAPLRRHLLALHAFDIDVARIRGRVSDPRLGEIRIQWWRDAVHSGVSTGHPLATALLETIREFSLPVAAFDHLLDARLFDLYDDPMPTLNDLEGYAGDTAAAVIQLGALILSRGTDPRSANAAGHAGVALTLARVLRGLPRNALQGQTFLPEAMVNSRGVDMTTVAARQATPQLMSLLADLRTIARQHLKQAELELAHLDRGILPAFLPIALIRPYLAKMEGANYDPFTEIELPAWRRQWMLWRAARTM